MLDRLHEEKHLSRVAVAVESLLAMNIIEVNTYEAALNNDSAIFMIKLRPENDFIVQGSFYIVKMTFNVLTGSFNPEEFSIYFCDDMLNKLPELKNFSRPELAADFMEDLVAFLLHVKDSVDDAIQRSEASWKKREITLLELFSEFEDGKKAVPDENSLTDAMNKLILEFQTFKRKVVIQIDLESCNGTMDAKVTVYSTKLETDSKSASGSKITYSKVLNLGSSPITKELILTKVLDIIATLKKLDS